MKRFFSRYLPHPDSLKTNRWLRWLGPSLFHPTLWHFSRRGVALGLSLGVFFGFLIPVGQIPLAAGAAVVLRANVPAAIASTLVTNPVTFAPVYYAAYRFGHWMVGENPDQEPPPLPQEAHNSQHTGFSAIWHRLQRMGKPLLVGLGSFAIGFGVAIYWISTWVWIWQVRRKRRARRQGPKRVM
jgi:uncharacterized protein